MSNVLVEVNALGGRRSKLVSSPADLADGAVLLELLGVLRANDTAADVVVAALPEPEQRLAIVLESLHRQLPPDAKAPGVVDAILAGDHGTALSLAALICRLIRTKARPRLAARDRKYDVGGAHPPPRGERPRRCGRATGGSEAHGDARGAGTGQQRGAAVPPPRRRPAPPHGDDAAPEPRQAQVVKWIRRVGHKSADFSAAFAALTVKSVPRAFASGELLCELVLRLQGGPPLRPASRAVAAGGTRSGDGFAARCARFEAALVRLRLSAGGHSGGAAALENGGTLSRATKLASGGSIWPLLVRLHASHAKAESDAVGVAPTVPDETEASDAELSQALDAEAASVAAGTAARLGERAWDNPEKRAHLHRWLYFGHGLAAVDTDRLPPFCQAPHVLDDALTNGLLLLRLAKASAVPFARPHVLGHARANLLAALKLLGRAAAAPAAALEEAARDLPQLLAGRRHVAWRLLWSIMLTQPRALPPLRPGLASGAAAHERELMLWLKQQLMAPRAQWVEEADVREYAPVAAAPPTFGDILPMVCTGELLCDLAERVSAKPLCGVFRPARTRATALQNIRRASQRLGSISTHLAFPEPGGAWEAELVLGEREALLRFLAAARGSATGRAVAD